MKSCQLYEGELYNTTQLESSMHLWLVSFTFEEIWQLIARLLWCWSFNFHFYDTKIPKVSQAKMFFISRDLCSHLCRSFFICSTLVQLVKSRECMFRVFCEKDIAIHLPGQVYLGCNLTKKWKIILIYFSEKSHSRFQHWNQKSLGWSSMVLTQRKHVIKEGFLRSNRNYYLHYGT